MNADAMAYLAAKGLTIDELIEFARIAEKRRDNTNAQRQARHREKKRNAVTVTPVTPPPNDIYSNPPPEPVEPNGSTPPCRFSVEDAVAAYNETAGRCGLNKAKTISTDRRKAISARLKANGEAGWREALAGVERSKFCRGENDRGFRADLDFVCQPKSFNRLREGFYGSDADAPGKVVQLDPQARAATIEGTAAIYDKQGRDGEAAQLRREAARLRRSASIGALIPEIRVNQ